MDKFHLIELSVIKDERGDLTVGQSGKEIPFDIKRIFYLTDTVADRGGHANKNSQFVFFVVKGHVEIVAKTKDTSQTFVLCNNGKALYMDKLVWKDMMNFSQDCILMVLSDCKYDKAEYINDYEAYEKL